MTRKEAIEEAAQKVAQECFPDEYNIFARENIEAKAVKNAFIAGANWQKEQMMKYAINAKIEQPFPTPLLPRLRLDLLVLEYYCSEHGFKHGDKVKVIIIKDE